MNKVFINQVRGRQGLDLKMVAGARVVVMKMVRSDQILDTLLRQSQQDFLKCWM